MSSPEPAYEIFPAIEQPVMGETLTEDAIESLYRLSWMQEGLLIHSLLTPRSDVYFRQTLYSLEGALDLASFERAWRQVVARHSILRTAFLWKDVEQPLQVVFREAGLRIEKEDWRGLTEVAQEQRLQRYLETNQERGFNLSEAPLLRLGLMRVADHKYHLVFAFHHLLLDGWSHTLVVKEVRACYEAYTQGRELQLPAPRPYRDYIQWLEDQDFVEVEALWRERLRGFSGATPLPFGSVASLKDAQDHGMRQIYLSPAETMALRNLARQHQVTLNTLVQGAWALLLSRHSGQRDVVFGATVAGRNPELAGIEGMVGVFINTLPVRVQFRPDETVLSWLKRLQAEQAAALKFDYSPLVEVQRWSEITPGTPLFETLLVFENYSTDSFEDRYAQELNGSASHEPSLKLKLVELEETVNYPLTLISSPGEKLLLRLLFHLHRFTPEVIERLLSQLRIILQGMASNPDRIVRQIPWMNSQEKQQLIEEWNQTEKQFPGNGTIVDAIEVQVETAPDTTAVMFEEDRLTYRELNARANQWAHYLRRSCVGPESRVGICMERSLDLITGLLAILKAGAAYVPLDPDYPPDRLAYMLEDSQCAKILTSQNWLERQDFADVLAPYADKLVDVHADQLHLRENMENPAVKPWPEHLAYVIYTSGSTGRPKGAMNTHDGLTNRILWMQEAYKLSANDRVLQKTPFSFDVSVWELFWPLMAGACLIVARPGGHQDPGYLGDIVRQRQITTMHFVPSMLRAFLESGAASECKSLRRLVCSGEALDRDLAEKCLQQLPHAALYNLYGPTEASIDVTSWKCETGAMEEGAPIGKPIANMQVYVLDEEMEAVPVGATGELYLGGVGLARGYINAGRLTAEKFVPDPFDHSTGARLYRTGDICRWRSDGNLEFVGRIDHQVKIHGYRIELDEINSVLLEHPDIKQAVVLARNDQSGGKTLAAYVVIHEGLEGVNVGQFRAYLQEILPHYMVPSVFVIMEKLPLTSSGKVDRNALSQLDLVRKSSSENVLLSPVEDIIAGIWCDVLKMHKVGRDDNFFELGGHSILATQVVSRVQNVFGIELPFRALFDAPTVAGLALQIEQGRKRITQLEAPPLKRIGRDRPLPLSFAQQRLWFLSQLYPDSPAYNIPLAVVLVGELDRDALRRSLQEIVRRHEVLRTRFPQRDGVPVQEIVDLELEIEDVDLRHLEVEPREREARRWMRAEAAAVFDLEHGPVLRAKLLQTRDHKHVLLLTIHHIASDGWSMGVMLREFVALYEAFRADQDSPLPELEFQYSDYAVWQRQWLNGEVLNQHLDYWRNQLSDLPGLDLPADGASASPESASENVLFQLSPEMTEQLRELSRQEGVTLFMTVLGAWQIALSRFTSQEDITVATAVANRTRVETETMIGFFVNTLLLRTRISEELSFSEILSRVRDTVLGAYDHQDVPFEKIVEEVHPSRNPQHSPLFRVMLAMQTAGSANLVPEQIAGLEIHPVSEGFAGAKHDLTLYLNDNGASINGLATFKQELFSRTKIAGFLENFKFILSMVSSDPGKPISELPWPDMQQLEDMVADFTESPDYISD